MRREGRGEKRLGLSFGRHHDDYNARIEGTGMAKAAAKRSTKRLSAAEVEAIFQAFHKANPEPKGELVAPNAYTLLVAVVLSAQATDAGVNKATPALFKVADTPEKMVKLGVDRIT